MEREGSIEASHTGARPSSLEAERLALERERLRLDRQKTAVDFRLRRQELSTRQHKSWLELISNPLTVAIVAGFLILMTTIVTSYYTQQANTAAEEQRAKFARESARQQLQAELIKKFVEAPKTKTVRENLRFLIGAHLIPDYEKAIQAYLDANPDAAPQVGPSGVIGADDRTPLSSSKGVGLVQIILGAGAQIFCSGFLVAPDVLMSGQCGDELVQDKPNAKSRIGTFELLDPSDSTTSRLPIDASRMVKLKSGQWAVVLLSVKVPPNTTLPYKPLDPNPPLQGQRFSMAFYAADKKTFVYSADSGCRVISVEEREIGHLCDTGSGAGGGPMVTPQGTVIGVHMGNGPVAKRAMRADVIRNDPKVIEIFGQLPKP